MKPIIIAMIVLLGVLQYELWFAIGGILPTYHLKQAIKTQTAVNQQLQVRNNLLVAEIKDLKTGNQAIEEHARSDLGMIKPGEVFYQIVK